MNAVDYGPASYASDDDAAALEELVVTARRFMRDEVLPLEATLEHDAVGLPRDQLRDLQSKARRQGLWALQTPREYGGAGLSMLGQVLIAEETAKCRMGAYFPALGACGGNPPSVLLNASPAQFSRYAEPIIQGATAKAYTAITEPSGGSDPARAIQLTARRDGDGWTLNGTKVWISHAIGADWGVVYARTGEGREGISCFIVESDTPGLTIEPMAVMSSLAPCKLTFQDVRVGRDQLVGAEGDGFELAVEFLVRARILYSAGPVGIAQAALDMACARARERDVFGGKLSEKQGIQWMLADAEIELRAARSLVHQAARNADVGRDVGVDASVAKIYATEAALRVVDVCIQVHGALGVSEELPLERWLRDLRVKRLGEGSSEVQRILIARHLLRG